MSPRTGAANAPGGGRGVRAWALWRAPRRVVALVLVVDVLALAAAVPPVVLDGLGARPHDVLTLGLLAAAAVAHAEIARRVDHVHRVLPANSPSIDPKSIWTFAGLLLLPLGPALVLVVLGWWYWSARVTEGSACHRMLYSCATAVLATRAAWDVLDIEPGQRLADLSSPTGLVLICVAGGVRWLVNNALVGVAIRATDPTVPWRRTLLAPGDVLLGAAALAAGVVLAVVWQTTPWFVPLLGVPLLVMHRGFLLPRIAQVARTDAKTGLLTATQWRSDAARSLARAGRRGQPIGVLMLDLDDFKSINDVHGHLVGDEVLRAVAGVLASEVPGGAVGRFGGEEFSIVASELTAPALDALDALDALAHRLRTRIADLAVAAGPATVRCTASIGTALAPHHGAGLDDLLLAADAALYEAKAAGRDRVRSAPTRDVLRP